MNNTPVVRIDGISKTFTIGSLWSSQSSKTIHAVRGVSFSINKSEVLGLVGESGSGKTTIGKIIAGFIEPDKGSVIFKNKIITRGMKGRRYNDIQMIFQDPYSSLNPKLTIGVQLAEAVKQGSWELPLGNQEIKKNVAFYCERVELPSSIMYSYPHQLSGGELQRVSIGRALAMQPSLIIADEPVSSLDMSIQAQILNMLKDLRQHFELSMLLITHDLSVVNYIADRVAVMRSGEIVEEGSVVDIVNAPRAEYTKQLIASVPQLL